MPGKAKKDDVSIHGRERLNLTTMEEKALEEMATMGMSIDDMADYFCEKGARLQRWYGDFIRQCRARGKKILFEAQWGQVKEGNTTMMTWIGKQFGQSERPVPADVSRAELEIRELETEEIDRYLEARKEKLGEAAQLPAPEVKQHVQMGSGKEDKPKLEMVDAEEVKKDEG